MIYVLAALAVLVACWVCFEWGYARGTVDSDMALAEVEAYWDKLKEIPIPGQQVLVPAFGEVLILGTGWLDDQRSIDYILVDALKGRSPSDLDEEELSRHTITCELDSFIAQAEQSLSGLSYR